MGSRRGPAPSGTMLMAGLVLDAYASDSSGLGRRDDEPSRTRPSDLDVTPRAAASSVAGPPVPSVDPRELVRCRETGELRVEVTGWPDDSPRIRMFKVRLP